MYRKEIVLRRHPDNPIISPLDFPDVDAVFNCGQTMFEGKTLLLLSVCPRDGMPRLHVATSEDGVKFDIEPEPFITQDDTPMPWRDMDTWPIDPRVTRIDDVYYIVRPIQGPACILQKTTDWKTHEFIECIALPCNRVASLFPEKINGLYYRVDRPFNIRTGSMWISSSPDLINWGRHRPLAKAPFSNCWAVDKIGPTPPLRTPAGWLMIFHGVMTYAGGGRYSLGAMLMDIDDPSRIIGHSKGWILTPDAPYEFMGNCQNCVFSCGAIADVEKDLIRVYYGAADTCIGLATGKLSELIELCLRDDKA